MTTINDIRGSCYPLTPGGVSSLVGDLPWHYATEYLTIAYRTDPAAIAAYLPEPLAPGPEPDLALRASIRKVGLVLPSERIAFATFDILGDVLPADAGGDRALHVADSQAVARRCLPIDLYVDIESLRDARGEDRSHLRHRTQNLLNARA
jgi:hypothetical protein